MCRHACVIAGPVALEKFASQGIDWILLTDPLSSQPVPRSLAVSRLCHTGRRVNSQQGSSIPCGRSLYFPAQDMERLAGGGGGWQNSATASSFSWKVELLREGTELQLSCFLLYHWRTGMQPLPSQNKQAPLSQECPLVFRAWPPFLQLCLSHPFLIPIDNARGNVPFSPK